MKFFQGIQFILISLLVALSPSTARACGDHSDASHVLKFHHQHQHATDHHAHACRAADHDHADSQKDCDDDEDDNHCHCPGCGGHAGSGHAGGLAADFHIFLTAQPSDDLLKKQAFYFSKHLPEAVCLPIWQPPQLAA